MFKHMKKENLAALLVLCTALSACDTDFDNPVDTTGTSGSAGDADFTTFVAIGDSLTAGYADSALYRSGQENSYPNILATQFAKVGGGTFTQPLMNDNLGGLLLGGNPIAGFDNRLVLDGATQSPEPIAGTPTTDVASPLTGSFNNMGVPGAKSFHLGAAGYGALAGLPASANPYYVRFASSATASMITDAAAQLPSFFVLWIGNNDVLSFATDGGANGVDQKDNLDPTTYGSNDITDPTAFAGVYSSLVGAFTTANPNAKGVLINIPDVNSIPFFTTVPYNAIPLDQSNADALNAAYAAYNGGLQQALAGNVITSDEATRRTINFAPGQNAVVILDESLTDLTGLNAALLNLRQATAEDLLVLTTSTKLGEEAVPGDPTTVWGLGTPLLDEDVLIPAEISAIGTARTAYNATIKGIADANTNLAFFDAASLLSQLKSSEIDFGTGVITAEYATGGGFSLDGVHPTARGYAVVANAIIDTINTAFNASVPKTDPGAFTTIFIK